MVARPAGVYPGTGTRNRNGNPEPGTETRPLSLSLTQDLALVVAMPAVQPRDRRGRRVT